MNKMETMYRRKRNICIALMSVLAVALIVLLTCLFAKRKDIPGGVSTPTEISSAEYTSKEESEEQSTVSSVSEPVSEETSESSVPEASSEPEEPSKEESKAESKEESSEEPSEEFSEEPSEEPSEEISETVVSDPDFPAEYINSVVDADYVAVYCVTDDKLLYGKNENAKAYPASMTKLVTAMLAEKYIPADQVITVGQEIRRIGPGSSQIYLYPTDEYDLENLLIGLLLPSGNDVAYTLAVAIGRNLLDNQNASIDDALDAFMKEANKFVKAIGCKNTHMACPDGYHDDDHYTTAYDYTIIGTEVLKNYPLTKKICGLEAANIQTVYGYTIKENGYTKIFYNSNPVIDETYVTGLKTGTTDEAGYCLALSTRSGGKEYVIILMHASSIAARNRDAVNLISAAHGWY